jgi:Fic family protein
MAPVHYHLGGFPPPQLDWQQLIPLLGPANASLARYDGLLEGIPNPAVLLSPLSSQEAVLSSRIEGTQATLAEVLEFEADAEASTLPQERRDDIREVQNYRHAMRQAVDLLDTLPLSLRVIKTLHATLLSGVRGNDKAPGEFRKIPNWIGPKGRPIEEARFIPISAEKLDAAMGSWESFIHAEFESLHPFLDGNGRIGRMVLPLFLWQAGILRMPYFYLSAYFEANKDSYVDRLLAISRDGDWTGWCRYFLEAVQAQAIQNQERANQILALYENLKPAVQEATHSQYAVAALDWIFSTPTFRATDFEKQAGIPVPTAKRILRCLENAEILAVRREASGRRPRVLCLQQLLAVAEGRP